MRHWILNFLKKMKPVPVLRHSQHKITMVATSRQALWAILNLTACYGTHRACGYSTTTLFGVVFRNQRRPTVRETSKTDLKMATWSDSKAVMEYQAFLSSGKQQIEKTLDVPSAIIAPYPGSNSPPELAECLAEIGLGQDLVLTPNQDLPATLGQTSEYPVYITLPPWQLDYFLQNLPESYKPHIDDFVFFSGGLNYGNIEHVLKDRGYCRDAMTQGLISGLRIAPNKRAQDRSVNLGLDSYNAEKCAGECSACGKWAGSIAQRLERSSVRCRTDFYREWRRKMWESNVLDAVFHLVGVVRREPTSLADVGNYYHEEVSDMVWDMTQLLRGWRALTLLYGFEERMFAIAEMHGKEQPCTIVEEMYPYIWGNQVFLQSKMFVDYLRYAQEDFKLLPNVQLPNRGADDFTSNMRKGNFRADGVV
jgi:hypothetical protein